MIAGQTIESRWRAHGRKSFTTILLLSPAEGRKLRAFKGRLCVGNWIQCEGRSRSAAVPAAVLIGRGAGRADSTSEKKKGGKRRAERRKRRKRLREFDRYFVISSPKTTCSCGADTVGDRNPGTMASAGASFPNGEDNERDFRRKRKRRSTREPCRPSRMVRVVKRSLTLTSGRRWTEEEILVRRLLVGRDTIGKWRRPSRTVRPVVARAAFRWCRGPRCVGRTRMTSAHRLVDNGICDVTTNRAQTPGDRRTYGPRTMSACRYPGPLVDVGRRVRHRPAL